jgi:phospho-2-dehydro-3-deoxyheptonate aldolase
MSTTGLYVATNLQELVPNQPPKPGLSITDPCLGWDETEKLLLGAAEKLRARESRSHNQRADGGGVPKRSCQVR